YTGNDFPEYIPLSLGKIIMLPEDTVHYPLTGPTASAQWASNNPRGSAYVHFGENHRFFDVPMFHQLHCLRYIRMALETSQHPYATMSHAQHCLNYLRQAILCHPDLTIEDPLWKTRPAWVPGRRETARVCNDWEKVYEEVELNLQRWEEWKNMTHFKV
ncbi:hypothetical protein M422DRAFT_152504, partial [Sphaerobolus stellatus SS14]